MIVMTPVKGHQYGQLTAIAPAGKNTSGRVLWAFRCSCGNEKRMVAGPVVRGVHKSCGCLKRAALKLGRGAQGARNGNFKHGKTSSPEFWIWIGLRRRCMYASYVSYPRYGGRGISLCERWRNSFENFLADIGPRPSAEHTIERIDDSGHYEPGNVRWATTAERINGAAHRSASLGTPFVTK